MKVFTKALILRHFNLKRHIWIEIDNLGYTISRVLNQIILDQLDQYFSDHMTYKDPIFLSLKLVNDI